MPDTPLTNPVTVLRKRLDEAIELQATHEAAMAETEQAAVAARTAVVDQRGRVAALRALLQELEPPKE